MSAKLKAMQSKLAAQLEALAKSVELQPGEHSASEALACRVGAGLIRTASTQRFANAVAGITILKPTPREEME